MKFFLIGLVLISSLSLYAQNHDERYSCRALKESQCLPSDDNCSTWGQIVIESLVLGQSFSATFFSVDDDECENCESVDFTFSKGYLFASDEKDFNLFTATIPQISLAYKKDGTLKMIILTTEEQPGVVYTHAYICKAEVYKF